MTKYRIFAMLAFCLLFFTTRVEASDVSVKITDFGLFRMDNVTDISDVASPGGLRHTGVPVLVKVTDRAPLAIGSTFGINFVISSSSGRSTVTLKRVVRFPSPGIKNLTTGLIQQHYESPLDYSTGNTHHFGYSLDSAVELVPGVWTIELWDGNEKIVEKSFIVGN
ncbi:MAG: DUF3859 domain-containing protein [Chlorobiaceae bacterium]|nr:DUF3859 domain-containing protein [Chlorobiaceae bacterium]HWR00313.1 DUF3859 domain-containing protein [Chlorobaculum sp.]